MSSLQPEIKTFEQSRAAFQLSHPGEWVLIKGRDVVGFYPTLDAAVVAARTKFGRQAVLIREIGENSEVTPKFVAMASVQNARYD